METHIILINAMVWFCFIPDKSFDWYERVSPVPLPFTVPICSTSPIMSRSKKAFQELHLHHHVIHLAFSENLHEMCRVVITKFVGVMKIPRICSKQKTPESLKMSVHPSRFTRSRVSGWIFSNSTR